MNITPGVLDDTLGVANNAALATNMLVSLNDNADAKVVE
jgi:hypothetical protein